MFYPHTVTITGADDATNINDLVELSKEFPFVEWGILVSRDHFGEPRFPFNHWISQFSKAAEINELQVATHICGAWVKELLIGELDWTALPACVNISDRIQINTHSETHSSTFSMVNRLKELSQKKFIFQLDGVNNLLPYALKSCGFRAQGLFDKSGGRGIIPDKWPSPTFAFPIGFAGGLGPDNVKEEISRINDVCRAPYWIDMQRRVRTEDDSSLDINKVRSVLQQVEEMDGLQR